MTSAAADALAPRRMSFRDPGGRVILLEDRVLRVVSRDALSSLELFLGGAAGQELLAAGDVASTSILNARERDEALRFPEVARCFAETGADAVVEHGRIPFPSYPYEWPPEMLHAAGVLTLEIARRLLPLDLTVKDATPYNVLFRGSKPVFIDLLSFEPREPHDPTWLAYAQFVRTFLLPLVAYKYFGVQPGHILAAQRDGLEPEQVYRMAGTVRRLLPPLLEFVTMPAWLGARHNPDDTSIYTPKRLRNPEQARFVVDSLLKRLRKALDKVAPKAGTQSVWSGYMGSQQHYTRDLFEAKQAFVRDALREQRPESVLDIGCNTGHFSFQAAESGARVVAIDSDPVVAGEVWRTANARGLDLLPLVVNVTRPTPAHGWRNAECDSFLNRSRGAFDGVLMLAVIHHMIVTERIPLDEILALAADLTKSWAIIEFVAPDDPMFQRIARGREKLHDGLTAAVFERCCATRFDILRVQHIEGSTRWLYLLKKRA